MTINNLPSSIQAVIQQGYLERKFNQALKAKLGFRLLADREPFGAGIGETVTKTRTGLLAPNTTPMAPAAVTDITSGLTNAQYGVEQYTLGVAQYANPMQLNTVTAKVAIDSLFLENGYTLGENAARSVDMLARNALFDQYSGGNTRVTATLGSPATTIHVDDVRGFFNSWTSANVPVAISSSNPLAVLVNGTQYSLTGCVADGTAPTTIVPWLANLSFSGTSSNSSTTPGGYSGTLTFSSNVSVANGTLNNAVVSAVAPLIIRPINSTSNVQEATTAAISATNDTNAGRLTMQMILTAKANMSANSVPPVTAMGNYLLLADPIQMTGLYADPEFQLFFRGDNKSTEYKRGLIAELLGVSIVETNLNPVQALSGVGTVRRAILAGQGALVEGEFTASGYQEALGKDENSLIQMVDGIAHITRPPLDVLQQVITQAWSYIGGFVAPTDITTTTSTIPTASNSAWKRAAVLESL